MTNRHEQRLSQIRLASSNRKRDEVPPEPAEPPKEVPDLATAFVEASMTATAQKRGKPTTLRSIPRGAVQPDFFLPPALFDVGTRDNRGIMDVAVFRLSKRYSRAQDLIRYNLPDGIVEVSSGAYGMATVWDYDVVLMAVSHLTEAMNRYRNGHGEKPGQTFKPAICDILNFCRRDNGGRQKAALLDALMRLYTTTVLVERPTEKGGTKLIGSKAESLIGPFNLTSNPKTGKVESVEIKVADWMYKQITQGTTPDVLTVHPNYFLIEPALGRFLYRLARMAAGNNYAWWGFSTLYERSGSPGEVKEFNRNLRSLIAVNDLPEYHLEEKPGKEGPVLVMTHRDSADHLKVVLKEDEWAQPEQAD
jgi:plasmid replication initiation protein